MNMLCAGFLNVHRMEGLLRIVGGDTFVVKFYPWSQTIKHKWQQIVCFLPLTYSVSYTALTHRELEIIQIDIVQLCLINPIRESGHFSSILCFNLVQFVCRISFYFIFAV